ncbi:MAG: hypothetical protein MUQ32_17725, partial [Chloroflexi bacterium]|nr:hypothetical protein [Chloroflexota bacterium]
SRVGQPLLSALIFVIVSGAFYATLSGPALGFDAGDPSLRALAQPLNQPGAAAPPELVDAALVASVDALHLAVTVCALLLLAGSLVNWIGLRPTPGEEVGEDDPDDPGGAPAPEPLPGGSVG